MTRSDNPFGDLPEWKERRRLQEAQEQHGYAPHANAPRHDPRSAPEHYAHGEDGQYGYGRDYGGPEHGDHYHGGQEAHDQSAWSSAPEYQREEYPREEYPREEYPREEYPRDESAGSHGTYGRAPLHYDLSTTQAGAAGRIAQRPGPEPEYGVEPQMAPTYGGGAVGQHPGLSYRDLNQSDGTDSHGLRHGQYDDGLGYQGLSHQGHGNYPAGQSQPGDYGLGATVPGQQGYGEAPVSYYNENEPHAAQWTEGDGAGAEAAPGLAVANSQMSQEGEAEYDDEYDDDEPMRFSWKLLAAVVVTGAVVAGGGVVLYDSFASGQASKNGGAPVIRAEQGPAKTAPGDAGGRKFAHQDSKLLGRLDNSGSSETPADADSSNRVRAVPTVRIGRDGRLILPKAPESVPAETETGSAVASAGASTGGQSTATATPSTYAVPGLNVVESINGNGNSSFGALPPALPKSEQGEIPQSAQSSQGSEVRQASAPELRPTGVPETSRQPVIKNRSAVNKVTTSGPPPPVPTKSSVGTAWRMTGTAAPASTSSGQPNQIRPTIAQRVSVLPSSTASTLGAAPATTATASTGQGGYVAVLATATSRMKALQSFAELQQKHPKALVNRVPDVQRADLTARGLGIMYRVVVGPASSRGAANSVCASLKSEGYNGCWVKTN